MPDDRMIMSKIDNICTKWSNNCYTHQSAIAHIIDILKKGGIIGEGGEDDDK